MTRKIKKPMRGVEAVIAVYDVSLFGYFRTLGDKGRRTAQQVALQALSQAEVRRPQGIVQLAKAAAVVPSLDITLDALEQGLDALKASVKGSKIALRGHILLQLRVARLALGGLTFHVLEDGVGGLVGKLEAAAQVNELSGNAGIENIFAGRGNGRRIGRRCLVLNRLLGSVVLIHGSTLARGGFQDELEDLEGVGVLGGGSSDTECVASRQSDLVRVSGLFTARLGRLRRTLSVEKQTLSSTVTSRIELVYFSFSTEGRPRLR